MNETVCLMTKLAKLEGFNNTKLDGVRVFKASQPSEITPFCYEQGVVFVAQGSEIVFYKGREYEYHSENYLVVSVPISVTCQVNASLEKPMLAVTIDLQSALLHSVVAKLKHANSNLPTSEKAQGLFVSPRTTQLQEILLRLLRVLQSPLDCQMLGGLIIEELLYRVLMGEGGHTLVTLTEKQSQLAKIDSALQWMHNQYDCKMDITMLAQKVNMSPSVFHRVFKDFTAKSPMQYLKSIRLNKAHELLAVSGYKVNQAAVAVGYESVSQFSREYKRAYGIAPKVSKHH